MAKAQEKKTRELTGRAVLFWLVGFFGLVFAVNAGAVQAADAINFGGTDLNIDNPEASFAASVDTNS